MAFFIQGGLIQRLTVATRDQKFDVMKALLNTLTIEDTKLISSMAKHRKRRIVEQRKRAQAEVKEQPKADDDDDQPDKKRLRSAFEKKLEDSAMSEAEKEAASFAIMDELGVEEVGEWPVPSGDLPDFRVCFLHFGACFSCSAPRQ